MKVSGDGRTIMHTRGDDGAFTIGSVTLNGEEVTDYTATFSVKHPNSDDEYVIQKTSTDGEFLFTPEDTASMSAGTYKFDIQIVLKYENNGEEMTFTPAIGRFILTEDITRNGV